ncbi:MAG TPA: hypothetical protein VN810_03810 [Terriglobales bacterium]|nr:hypothetical protein [Terriglobales bacterium]
MPKPKPGTSSPVTEVQEQAGAPATQAPAASIANHSEQTGKDGQRDRAGRFLPHHQLGIKPGETRNPGGRPKTRRFRAELVRALREVCASDPQGRRWLRLVVQGLISAAAGGNPSAAREIADRLDGLVGARTPEEEGQSEAERLAARAQRLTRLLPDGRRQEITLRVEYGQRPRDRAVLTGDVDAKDANMERDADVAAQYLPLPKERLN